MRPGSPLASLLQGDVSGRPIVIPMVAANHAARLAGITLRRAVTDAAALADVLYTAFLRYGADGTVVFADTVVEAEALGCRVEIPEDEDPYLLESPGTTGLEPVDPEKAGRLPVMLATIRKLVGMTSGRVPILGSLKGPFSLAAFLAGADSFLADLLEQPARARDFLRVALDNQRRYLAAIVRAGGLPFIGDPVASGSMVGPELFGEFARPGLARLVDDAHELGAPVGLHICGDTSRVLGHMRATGADFISIDDIDLALARRELGADMTIMGNVSTELLLAGTPQQVRKAAERCLELGRPRLILSSACDVPPEAPAENVEAMVLAAREWRAGD